ncbi:MAG TPA: hypothetical protein DG753_13390 [Clostridium sp.]|nr:hypothetical protein [Clostridium sp.]
MINFIFLVMQLILENLWIIRIININIHSKKNVIAVDTIIVILNAVLLLNLTNIFKVIILLHIINLTCIFLFYKENQKKAVMAFAVAYFICLSINYFQINGGCIKIIEFFIKRKLNAENYCFVNFCFFVSFMIIIRIFHDYIKRYVHVISKNVILTILMIISGFFLDMMVLNAFCKNFVEIMGDSIANIRYETMIVNTAMIVNKVMIINILLFTIAIVYITMEFDNKLDSMEEVNTALEIKNNELGKIKHDYGAQISYLYGLYLLCRWKELGEFLKKICVKNSQVSNVVSIKNNENSIIYKALKPALDEGIHVLLEEGIESSQIDINDDLLFYILSVIRENTVNYLEHDGIIIVRVYRVFESAVIEIENSCTHVKDKKFINLIKRIYFNCIDGWEDIYKLNEIKKLIEENNGDIYIKNKYISTLININLPLANEV